MFGNPGKTRASWLVYEITSQSYEFVWKDGRSFGKARTFAEETEAIRTAISSSTRYKNKWAVEVFKEWQYYRATKGETSSEVDDNVQTVDTPFKEMNGESMAY